MKNGLDLIFLQLLRITLLTLGIVTGWGSAAQAQRTVNGQVAETGSGAPVPFASVAVRGTAVGTSADDEGRFQLVLKQPADTLVVTAVGYQTTRVALDSAQTQPLTILLTPANQTLSEVVVRAGENPAFRILREVVAHRNQTDYRRAAAYEYEAYSQLTIGLNQLSEGFRRRGAVQKLLRPFEQAQLGRTTDSAFVLPVFVSETVSRLYGRQQPTLTKERILKTNISSVGLTDDSFVALFTGAGFNTLNFYQNTVGLFRKEFISPLSANGRAAYTYFLVDTTQMGRHTCYAIDFDPHNPRDLVMQGRVWIDTLTYALVQIEGRISPEANINFINGIRFEQTYETLDSAGSYWLPERLHLTVSVGELVKNTFGARVEYLTTTRQAQVNQPKPTGFFDTEVDLASDSSAAPETYWQTLRTTTDQSISVNARSMLDTLRSQPIVRTYVRATTFALNGGYVRVLPGLQVGSLLSVWAYNQVEGHRLRLGLQTNNAFSRRWQLAAYAAYGTRDRVWKSGLEINFIPSRQPLTLLAFKTSYDLDQLGLRSDEGAELPFFSVVNRFGQLPRAYYQGQTSLSVQRDVLRDITSTMGLRHRTFDPAFPFAFRLPTPLDSAPMAGVPMPGQSPMRLGRAFATGELFGELRYAPGRLPTRRANSTRLRRRSGTVSPVITLRYAYGVYWTPGAPAEIAYHKVQAEWQHALRWGLLGRTEYTLQAGYTPSTLPFPLLSVHVGNQTPFYNRQAYNLMNVGEFVSDRYVSLSAEHRFDGWLTNRLPLIGRWAWRSFLTANVLWGRLSVANQQLLASTDGAGQTLAPVYALGSVPYVEVGYGVENVFKVLRLDIIHRLTYRQVPGAIPFALKASFRFSL
ncbi:DUF5686 family protein [uncultured Fibrella sp.]|uniref:DUF5686 and carboxypeptidase-like regulatory domain-containing protein n=1 Tax=uncultured Fibrella sp. TaxID=1284596 RepID=UPI0035CA36D6